MASAAKASAYSCKSCLMASTSALFQRNSFRRRGLRRGGGGGLRRGGGVTSGGGACHREQCHGHYSQGRVTACSDS